MSINRESLLKLKQPNIPASESNPVTLLNNNHIENTDNVIEQIRPLGLVSEYVVNELGKHNKMVRDGEMSASQLFDKAEEMLKQIPEGVFQNLLRDDRVTERRAAILDLVWMIRSLDIAHDSAFNTNSEYISRRDASLLLKRTKLLADKENRHPNLSWSDISLYHPVDEPRTFLEPSAARDQEILLYRTQSGIDKTFKEIVEGDYAILSLDRLSEVVQDLDAVVEAVVYLNRVRTPGQFYQLDPYLGGNGQYIGHGTGAFSAWSYLAGYFLGGNEAFKDRLLRDENQKAYDRDADSLIEQVREGKFKTLPELIAESTLDHHQRELAIELAKQASDKFALFLRAHRGAIKKHAEGSFGFPAPAALEKTNQTAIDEAIAGMNDGKKVEYSNQ